MLQPLQLLGREIEAEQPIDGAVESVQKICRHELLAQQSSHLLRPAAGDKSIAHAARDSRITPTPINPMPASFTAVMVSPNRTAAATALTM